MNDKVASKKDICFIINPISGGTKKKDVIEQIKANLNQQKFNASFFVSQYQGHAVELSKKAIADAADIIVAVGGDGTINEVATQLIGTESVLGIIPYGSGNGLARHLGIPRAIPAAIQTINESVKSCIDTATINGKPFISIAGIGFDALVAKKFINSQRRGFLTYFKIVADHFLKYKSKKYRLVLENGEKIVVRALFISFANSNQFGYDTQIAPNAQLNDGKLDICIVEKPPLLVIPLIVNLLLLKKIHYSPYVKIVQSNSVLVKRKGSKVVNIDGEAIRMSRKLEIKVLPNSLQVIMNKKWQKKIKT